MKIAFIGLGNMGGGMAANLAKAGHDVLAFDLSPDALERARDNGCTPFTSVRDAVAGADAVENIAAAWGQITSFEHSDHPAGFGEAMAPFARIMQGG